MAEYATVKDIESVGLPPDALEGISPTVIKAHIRRASGRIDSYARSKYSVPFVAPFDEAIIEAAAVLAAYSLLVWKGFNPDEHDSNFAKRHDDYVGRPGQLGWLDKLSRGFVSVAESTDATPDELEGAPTVDEAVSFDSDEDQRGWAADAFGIRTPGRI